ncbi:MAG TPA: type II toxin-antitoxin system Phd/YefM family antitoxin [Myxococcales bacterium]|nr:type II toxin-antitoxin system Phd/YefM family antitoxin [Myxococcales bacterium]
MAELCVTASEFRVHMKDYGNQVSSEQDRVVVARNGRRLFAVVSEEDLEFLRKHKPNPRRAPVPDPVPALDIPEPLPHPEAMKTDEIERVYALTTNVKDDSRIVWWRVQAYTVLRLRGRRPAEFAYGSTSAPCYTGAECASAPSSGPPRA